MVTDVLRHRMADAGFGTAAKEIKSVDNSAFAVRLWAEFAESGKFYDPTEGKFFIAPMQLKPRRIK